jgi:cytoskeletal protein RodZ
MHEPPANNNREQLSQRQLSEALINHSDGAVIAPRSSMPTPGQLLRFGREAMNLTVEAAAVQVKLSEKHLLAIEENRFDELPFPSVFIKGHMRLYANFLKISAEDVLRCYAHFTNQSEPEKKQIDYPVSCNRFQKSRFRLSRKWLLMDAAIILMLIMSVAWYVHGNHQGVTREEPAKSQQTRSTVDRAQSPARPKQVFQLVSQVKPIIGRHQ